ncbi:hypothetical protein [Halanaerobium hydrogeniformans]|uniref:DUF5723 domain-containing protein n=1 Tax=Halanaerobium hydrogeniformans TaxID=656519 RepID=E4RPY7_HALHG|nr:hypothetical protein [Halanaerobium hydrogeniformans]ADQ14354.1 hypothetical protein Halsa_0908 [Halanaerobium hydrogeniformans]
MYKKRLIILFVCIILLTTLNAQAALNPRAIGLGHDFSTLSGDDFYYSNPAGLAGREKTASLKSFASFSAWNNILDNTEFTEDVIKSKLEDEDLILAARSAAGVHFYYKNFALGISGRADGLMELDSDVTEILTADKPQITFENGEITADSVTANFDVTQGGAAAAADISLSYARPVADRFIDSFNENRDNKIESIYLGGTFHYLEGDIYNFSGDGEIKAELENQQIKYSGEAEFITNRTDQKKAVGSVFDLGINLKMEDRYSFAFALMNIGELSANNFIRDGYKYYPDENDNTELIEEEIEDQKVEEQIKYKLPLIYKLGAKLDYSENTAYYAEYSRVDYDNGPTDNIFSFAGDFRQDSSVPLRFGVNYASLRESLEVAAGLSLNFNNFKIDFGMADLRALFDDAKSVKLGLGTTITF